MGITEGALPGEPGLTSHILTAVEILLSSGMAVLSRGIACLPLHYCVRAKRS